MFREVGGVLARIWTVVSQGIDKGKRNSLKRKGGVSRKKNDEKENEESKKNNVYLDKTFINNKLFVVLLNRSLNYMRYV